MSDAADIFGVPRRDLKRPRPPKPKPGEEHRALLSSDDLRWVELFLDLSAKQVWMDANLRARDADLARECVDHGLSPYHLGRLVGSNPIWWWITEGGQSVEWVVKQMSVRRGRGGYSTG